MTDRSHRPGGPEPATRKLLTSAFALWVGTEPPAWSRRWGSLTHGMCHGCAIGAIADGAVKLMTPSLTCGNGPNHWSG